MPIYAYRCATCGHAQDVLQKMSDPVLGICPACGAATYVKQVTAAGFQLKGSGWYVTDFRGDKKTGKSADSGDDKNDTSDKVEKGEKSDSGDAKAATAGPADANGDGGAKKKTETAPAAAAPTAAAPSAAPAPTAPAAPPAASGKTGT